MKKRKKAHHKRKTTTQVLHLRLVFSTLLLVLVIGGTLLISRINNSAQVASTPKNSLQIETFSKETPTPLPQLIPVPTSTNQTIYCNGDDGKPVGKFPCVCNNAFLVECKNQQCVKVYQENLVGGVGNSCQDIETILHLNLCAMPNMTGNKDGIFCVGKPVIYLYPEKDTLVDVSVQTSGKIIVSDPLYPANGWQNVLAHPNGKLEYQGKNYRELFYESNVKDFEKPEKGLGLRTDDLRNQLDTLISKLGLINEEKTEFLDWWVPRLEKLHSKYIFFSILDPLAKETIDHVAYVPEPTTRIEFIAYFKPLSKPYEGKALELPATVPQRIGFTAVEWGGILDN